MKKERNDNNNNEEDKDGQQNNVVYKKTSGKVGEKQEAETCHSVVIGREAENKILFLQLLAQLPRKGSSGACQLRLIQRR